MINWLRSFFKGSAQVKKTLPADKLLEIVSRISKDGIHPKHRSQLSPLDRLKVAISLIEQSGVDSSNPAHIQALYEETMKLGTDEMYANQEDGISDAHDQIEERTPSANAFIIKNASKLTH